MQTTRSSADTAKGPADWFTGDVYVDPVRPGDRVLLEADEDYWHGATATRLMVHLAINEADDDHAVVHWLQPVTDDEYSAPPTNS